MTLRPCRSMRDSLSAVVSVAVILAAGCASLPDDGTPASIPSPPLQLVSAGNLDLPRECEVPDGVVYRTNFTVQGDGRIADIRPDPAPACLRLAVAQWLDSVRYAPPGKAVPTAIDWMGVSASRSN